MNQTKPNDAKNNAAPTDAVNYSAPPKTFSEAISTCFSKYFDFNGRASRSEFWWFALFQNSLFFGVTFLTLTTSMIPLIVTFVIFAIPGIAVSVRRLHDVGYSGWWCLALIIFNNSTVFGWIAAIGLLIMLALPPITGKTKYDT